MEPTFDFASMFSYNAPGEGIDKTIHDYGSVFKYRNEPGSTKHVHINVSDGDVNLHTPPAFWLVVTSWVLTFFSYAFFVLTIPVSYWILVKKMGEFDRMVVFRLGKNIGVKGPGRFVIFPWMDRVKSIDVRASAFAVPPQQFITVDGGIVEMGAEIQYGIVDVITMVSEVADHQDILRSLGKTLLVKILVKKTVVQLEKDKRTPESEILDEINDQVRKWGINIQNVALSAPKVLKQAESGSNSAVGSILKGLGMKDEPKYPTPSEFVRASHGLEESDAKSGTASLLPSGGPLPTSGYGQALPPGYGSSTTSVDMSLLQSLAGGSVNGAQMSNLASSLMSMGASPQAAIPTMPPPPMNPPPQQQQGGTDEFPANWGNCLETIINAEFGPVIEDDAHGLYKLEITETGAGSDIYFIDISPVVRRVSSQDDGRRPDVSVVISSSDLASVLDGTLAPLQAYLTGRITANGDVKKLMFFDKLSRRGHKSGSMFQV